MDDAGSTFERLDGRAWQTVFCDRGDGDWRQRWFMDGRRGSVQNTPEGMVFSAGPVAGDHASHAVLWTNESFDGDLRIQFAFTRLDTIFRFVNILYIQATGTDDGVYGEDIAAWRHLREIPLMSSYYDLMRLLHVSFAAHDMDNQDPAADYIRVRRYPCIAGGFDETEVPPDVLRTGLFAPGVEHQMTFIKTRDVLAMDIRCSDVRRTFAWDLSGREAVTHGRVGIRQMWTRCSRYRDFTIQQA